MVVVVIWFDLGIVPLPTIRTAIFSRRLSCSGKWFLLDLWTTSLSVLGGEYRKKESSTLSERRPRETIFGDLCMISTAFPTVMFHIIFSYTSMPHVGNNLNPCMDLGKSVNYDIFPSCRILKSWPYLLRFSIILHHKLLLSVGHLRTENKPIQHTEHTV